MGERERSSFLNQFKRWIFDEMGAHQRQMDPKDIRCLRQNFTVTIVLTQRDEHKILSQQKRSPDAKPRRRHQPQRKQLHHSPSIQQTQERSPSR